MLAEEISGPGASTHTIGMRGGETIIRGYEDLLIFDPGLDEPKLESELDKLVNLIKERGGTVVEVNRWGKTPLAYEIDKKKQGLYVLIGFFAEPAVLSELDEQIKLNPSVVRHSVGRTGVEPPLELTEKAKKKPRARAAAKRTTTPAKKSKKKTEKKPRKSKLSAE